MPAFHPFLYSFLVTARFLWYTGTSYLIGQNCQHEKWCETFLLLDHWRTWVVNDWETNFTNIEIIISAEIASGGQKDIDNFSIEVVSHLVYDTFVSSFWIESEECADHSLIAKLAGFSVKFALRNKCWVDSCVTYKVILRSQVKLRKVSFVPRGRPILHSDILGTDWRLTPEMSAVWALYRINYVPTLQHR